MCVYVHVYLHAYAVYVKIVMCFVRFSCRVLGCLCTSTLTSTRRAKGYPTPASIFRHYEGGCLGACEILINKN